MVRSTGGLYEAEQAQTQCVRMLESGPAAGVIGTKALCDALGIRNAIAFDMGGTTAKAGVIYKGEPLTTGAALLGGYEKALPVQIAMMDIFEVGTGGGSIARVGAEGGLHVGPPSAGPRPGPTTPRSPKSRAWLRPLTSRACISSPPEAISAPDEPDAQKEAGTGSLPLSKALP